MSKDSDIQHVQALMFKTDIMLLKTLTGENNKKDMLSACIEAFLELRPKKENGRWIVPSIFPNRFKK